MNLEHHRTFRWWGEEGKRRKFWWILVLIMNRIIWNYNHKTKQTKQSITKSWGGGALWWWCGLFWQDILNSWGFTSVRPKTEILNKSSKTIDSLLFFFGLKWNSIFNILPFELIGSAAAESDAPIWQIHSKEWRNYWWGWCAYHMICIVVYNIKII